MPTQQRLLAPGLLAGAEVVIAGPPRGGDGLAGPIVPDRGLRACATACAALGAHVRECRPTEAALLLDEAAMEEAVAAALGHDGAAQALVVDAAGFFAGGGRDALVGCLQASWNVARTVANRAFLGSETGGRAILLCPPPGAGEHADAAVAALENLARTLSIEWARHGVTAVAVAPGDALPADELASLVAYLLSPAGAYFSGCLLDLRGGSCSS